MSKFLNRIAPQDEVLLETDIGTMVPSTEQLVEERVTRFKADTEIRLRVKTLEEKAPDAAVEAAKNQALAAVDTKAQAVNTALDGKLATANTAINEAVGKAETAKGDAVKAKDDAEKAKDEAVASATNAMRYTYAEPLAVDGVVTLVDRAVNKVVADGDIAFALPSAIDGRVRDLMIDLTLSAETSVTFDGVVLPRDGDDSNLAPDVGRNIFLLTEIEPNIFLCSRCTIAEVAV